jgi:hypothetical protein
LNRKLMVFNAVLLAVVIYAGFELRSEWQSAKAREAAMLNHPLKPAAPLPYTPLPEAPPVLSAGYQAIAQQMLFHPSRNPNVVVDPVIVEAAPPPPPMPALPRFHGQMNMGDGPTAILSENSNAPHHALKPGDRVGQFTLVDVNTQDITFEWQGQMVRKPLAELTDRVAVADARPAAQSSGPATETMVQRIAPAPTGPGAAAGATLRACNPNDSTEAGAVVDGFRKVVTSTPFGPSCRWEPVGR